MTINLQRDEVTTKTNRINSEIIYDRLCNTLVAGVNSPVRANRNLLDPPLVVHSAHGAMIRDVDGNEYIDYCSSWGALIHGHAHPQITENVIERLRMGSSFGATSEIEAYWAEIVQGCMPSLEAMRCVSSGTEATMTALRVARGFTGRDFIVKFEGNYHGHSDGLLVKAGSGVLQLKEASSAGVPNGVVQYTITLPFNDSESIERLFSDPMWAGKIAAVIVEPIAANIGVVPASLEFLQTLRQQTEKTGALLIFDEVVTGFRVGLGGAQGYYNIRPDLTCLGKIVGGGFPAAALGGRKEVMNCLAPLGGVYQAGTLSGNPVAMEAGYQAVKMLKENPMIYAELETKANWICHTLQRTLHKERIQGCVQQVGSMWTLFFGVDRVTNLREAESVDKEMFRRLFCWMFERGVYLPPSPYEAWFVSTAHTREQLEQTTELLLEFLQQG